MDWVVEKDYHARKARLKEGSCANRESTGWEEDSEGSASTNVLPSAIEREAPTWKGTIWLDLGRGRPFGIGV